MATLTLKASGLCMGRHCDIQCPHFSQEEYLEHVEQIEVVVREIRFGKAYEVSRKERIEHNCCRECDLVCNEILEVSTIYKSLEATKDALDALLAHTTIDRGNHCYVFYEALRDSIFESLDPNSR